MITRFAVKTDKPLGGVQRKRVEDVAIEDSRLSALSCNSFAEIRLTVVPYSAQGGSSVQREGERPNSGSRVRIDLKLRCSKFVG